MRDPGLHLVEEATFSPDLGVVLNPTRRLASEILDGEYSSHPDEDTCNALAAGCANRKFKYLSTSDPAGLEGINLWGIIERCNAMCRLGQNRGACLPGEECLEGGYDPIYKPGGVANYTITEITCNCKCLPAGTFGFSMDPLPGFKNRIRQLCENRMKAQKEKAEKEGKKFDDEKAKKECDKEVERAVNDFKEKARKAVNKEK